MGGPMLLWHILHCKQMKRRIASRSGVKENENNQGPSRRRSHSLKVKTEKNDFEYEQSTCRVCLKHGDIPIYGCVDVSEELSLFTGVEITPDDLYPQYLCESCNSQLESAISLRKTAQDSDQRLKQATQDISINSNMETNDDVEESDGDHDDWFETIQQSEKINRKSSDEYSSDYDEDTRKKNRARALNAKDTTTLEEMLREFDEYKEAKVKFEEVRPKTFHCIKCNMDFETMEDYSAHRLSAEHDNLRKTCPICNNSYNSTYLKKHLALHKKEKPYMCDICGKKFAIQGQFNRHRVTHFITELPFKCSVCPYRGRFRENLNLHMRTHTNDKRYQCPQCPTRYFINKSNLNRHMLTHKADHDFKCNQCQRGFYRKKDLELHFKVDHTGIKDHICDLCGKAFGFRKQMMKHQVKVHKRQKMRSGRTPLYILLDSKKQHEDMQETSGQDGNFEKTPGEMVHHLNDGI